MNMMIRRGEEDSRPPLANSRFESIVSAGKEDIEMARIFIPRCAQHSPHSGSSRT